ncbi:hypothetical protein KWD35_15640, partial [Listeria monocytogenes]
MIAHDFAANFVDFTLLQIAQLEGAIADANQAVYGQSDVLHRTANFAVLTFAQAHSQPSVRTL